MNYYAVLVFKRKSYVENDSFELVFQIYDNQNTLITDLSAFKFQCVITDDSYILTKRDETYATGADTQISVSADKVTVKIEADDTDNYEGSFKTELQIEKVSDATFRQTVYVGSLKFAEEDLEED